MSEGLGLAEDTDTGGPENKGVPSLGVPIIRILLPRVQN